MIAVYYDVENLEKLENCESAINIVKNQIIKQQSSLQFAYAEWGRFSNEYRELFISYGIVQKQVINGVGYYNNIKNAADIALSIDAVELIIKNSSIDHIILVSGDGDYISLVNKIKEYGKKISIVSLDENLNKSLIHFADSIYTIEKNFKQISENKKEIYQSERDKVTNEHLKNYSQKQYSKEEKESIIYRDKTIWALAKNSDNIEEYCNEIINSRVILNSLKIEALSIFFLIKSYLKAKDTLDSVDIHKEQDKLVESMEKVIKDKFLIKSGKLHIIEENTNISDDFH